MIAQQSALRKSRFWIWARFTYPNLPESELDHMTKMHIHKREKNAEVRRK